MIWTANAFALLGLGSLLALVDILVRRFRYLDETIALILGFVGIKILVADLVHISDLASLAVIGVLIAGGVVASLVADRLDPPRPPKRRPDVRHAARGNSRRGCPASDLAQAKRRRALVPWSDQQCVE